jgi:hypothetical protein
MDKIFTVFFFPVMFLPFPKYVFYLIDPCST